MRKRTTKHQLKSSDIAKLRCSLLIEQGGICLICDKVPLAPVLDHHHTKRIKGTGLVRGVLCRSCNVLLGKMENNCVRYGICQVDLPRILRKMAEYLEKPQHAIIHPSEAPKRKKLQKSSYNKLVKAVEKSNETTNLKWKVPEYPKSGCLTKPLARWFHMMGVEPRYYESKNAM